MAGYLTNPAGESYRANLRHASCLPFWGRFKGREPIRSRVSESVSLLQAIGMAGGYTRIANPSKVVVKRREGGTENVYEFNAKKMARTGADSTFRIMPGDVITVAESIF